MEIERQHRPTATSTSTTTTTTTTSDLFICFTSRLSHSSSMRLSARSILSPGRNGGGGGGGGGGSSTSSSAVATSLSRRLRRNGSLRGGAQSPALFPATAKKARGSGFSANAENPEPSSPKVTCIGQVRVKTKKQGKKMKLRACGSKRLAADASFRRIQPPPPPPAAGGGDSPARNPRWVHLPLSICETLSCLLPCKSTCFSSNNDNDRSNNKNNRNNGGEERESDGGGGCGGVMRWWVSVEERGEGGGRRRRRDIELVVGGDENEEEKEGVVGVGERVRVVERECSRRRSIFDDMEFDDLFNSGSHNVGREGNDKNEGEEGVEGGGGRVSVCVPPKNALLLMRCKSDPMRMASLSKKFLEASFVECLGEGEGEGEERDRVEFGEEVDKEECVESGEVKEGVSGDLVGKMEEDEEEKVEEVEEDVGLEEIEGNCGDEVIEQVEGIEIRDEAEEEQGVLEEEIRAGTEKQLSVGIVDEEEDGMEVVEENEIKEGENNVVNEGAVEMGSSAEEEVDESEICRIFDELPKYEVMEVQEEEKREVSCDDELCTDSSTCGTSLEESKELDRKEEVMEVVKEVVEEDEVRKSVEKSILPDCLLLMMCEPKLSMEVSKETWVCRSDFVRCLPERHPNKKPNKPDVANDQPVISTKKTKLAAVAAHPPLPPPAQGGQTGIRPGRSSISFPTGGSTVANLIEQKLAKAGVGYEPFVLPRCKSAPLRSAAKFMQPELACSMWGRENGRKLEPHRPATCGVGAAGVGF